MSGYVTNGVLKASFPSEAEEYPYLIPEVYLSGHMEDYGDPRGVDRDEVILVRAPGKKIYRYTRISFTEVNIEMDGERKFIPADEIPDGISWPKNKEDIRDASEYRTTVYDLETKTKKVYKMVLEEESPINPSELKDFTDMSSLEESTEEEIHISDEDLPF